MLLVLFSVNLLDDCAGVRVFTFGGCCCLGWVAFFVELLFVFVEVPDPGLLGFWLVSLGEGFCWYVDELNLKFFFGCDV